MAVLSGLHLQFFYILHIWVEEWTDLIQVDGLFLRYICQETKISNIYLSLQILQNKRKSILEQFAAEL